MVRGHSTHLPALLHSAKTDNLEHYSLPYNDPEVPILGLSSLPSSLASLPEAHNLSLPSGSIGTSLKAVMPSGDTEEEDRDLEEQISMSLISPSRALGQNIPWKERKGWPLVRTPHVSSVHSPDDHELPMLEHN